MQCLVKISPSPQQGRKRGNLAATTGISVQSSLQIQHMQNSNETPENSMHT
jgi:hypothetical protein